MRRILAIAASAFAATTTTACTAALEGQLAQLQTQLREVTRQVGQSQVRHEAMQNRVLVLEEELRRKRISELQTPQPAAALHAPAADATVKHEQSAAAQTGAPAVARTPAEVKPDVSPARASAPRRESVVDEMPVDLPMVKLGPGEAPAPSAQRPEAPPPAPFAAPSSSAPAAKAHNVAPYDADAAAKDIPKLTPKVLYRRGLAAFRRGHNERALAHFAAFVSRFPEHSLADNALYWSGRAHWKRGDHDTAIAVYRRCIDRYPTGNKVPDAWLALSEVLSATGRASQARDKLAHLTKNYPASSAARIASRRLSENKP